MRRIILFLLIAIAFLSSGTYALAQESSPTATPAPTEEPFDFNKAYKDYIYMTDLYKKAHADYILARAQYMQAQTLASQTKAKEATAAMLQARDDVLMSYLTALRLRLMETQGINDSDKEGLFTRIDNEVSWYRNHKAQIPSAGTLPDLVADSDEAKEHYKVTEPLAFEILAVIPIGKTDVLRTDASTILSLLKTKASEIRANGDLDTTLMERWTIETEFKITRSLDKQIDAQKSLAEIQRVPTDGRRIDRSGQYESVLKNLQESNQFIKEAVSFMKEIIREMKTQQ